MNVKETNELSLYLKSLPRLADGDKESRVKSAKADFWTFIKTYFSHHIDFTKTETSVFRQFIHQELYSLSKAHKKLLFTAYRGGAKTTTITKLFTLWLLVKGETRFSVIISATDKLINQTFEFFRDELEDNANLRFDFDLSLPSTLREKEIVVKVGTELCKLQGFGAGTKLRGLNFLSFRPDLIILDDLENDEHVQSKVQRDKLENWFKKAVMKLPGWRKHYRLIVVGTILHNDGLLPRLSKRKDFKSFNFPLVRKFPDDADMHDPSKWILDNPQINATEIMHEYFEDKDSFMSEYQNTPLSKEGLLFDEYTTFDNMPRCEVYWIGLDPAMGKKKRDYFGVALLGKKDDKFYLSVKGYRMSPVKLVPRIIALYSKHAKIAPTTIACEVVQFQEFFKDVLKKEAAAIGIPLAVKELRNTAPKQLRIDSIAPLINDGTIQIHAKDQLLIEELDTYPSSAHDDLLDAAEMAYRLFRGVSSMNFKEVREQIKNKGFGRFKNKYA